MNENKTKSMGMNVFKPLLTRLRNFASILGSRLALGGP